MQNQNSIKEIYYNLLPIHFMHTNQIFLHLHLNNRNNYLHHNHYKINKQNNNHIILTMFINLNNLHLLNQTLHKRICLINRQIQILFLNQIKNKENKRSLFMNIKQMYRKQRNLNNHPINKIFNNSLKLAHRN